LVPLLTLTFSTHIPRPRLFPPHLFFFLIILPPPRSTLFPYTTLFRSVNDEMFQSFDPEDASWITGGKVTYSVSGTVDSTGKVDRSEEHTSELQSLTNLVCRLLLEKKKKKMTQ